MKFYILLYYNRLQRITTCFNT